MEFSALTRRVAEYSEVDIADVMPDARLAAGVVSSLDDGFERAPAAGKAAAAATQGASGTLPLLGGKNPSRPQSSTPQPKPPDNDNLTPKALADARAAAAREGKFDRSKYVTLRSLGELKSWIARAKDAAVVAIGS